MSKLYSSALLGSIKLTNRIVMAPMTRSRAVGNVPNDLMAKYYEQRSSAGLIITEGTSPSANGLGYARIPGIYTQQQVDAWKKASLDISMIKASERTCHDGTRARTSPSC